MFEYIILGLFTTTLHAPDWQLTFYLINQKCFGNWLLMILLQAVKVTVNEVDFNPDFIARMIPKLEWQALVKASKEVSN